MKAPGSDVDDQDDLKTAWTDESLERAYHKKELHTFLIKNPVMQTIKPKIISEIIAGSFDANDLFDARLSTINTALMSTFDLLKPMMGEKSTGPASHYESATENVDTDSAYDPPQMTLGLSGAAMLRQRGDQETKRMMDVIVPTMLQGSNANLESYFQAALNRFLKEQQIVMKPAR
ncbi:Hypothetical protein PHPALM_15090 [Phytophthora palmivora]|uniref:Uncharacterized protein n=1 Tax=Phytophthora palmivora TaxID=4796 RepID=A0A2P4XT46_9STRA|nr:Hypothetical protein PHPALM_15090 [Phytophthora palmivora]